MKSKTEKQIETEFNKLVERLDDNQFWAYVRGWKDEQDLLDTMNNWDINIKNAELKILRKILREK